MTMSGLRQKSWSFGLIVAFFALWQLFNDTPLNLLAVEILAKWSHPDRFTTLHPDETLAEINRRFLAVPMTGTYWIER